MKSETEEPRTLEKLLRGAAAGVAALAIFTASPDYRSLHTASAQETNGIVYGMQVNGYTFDYNPNGWTVPKLDETGQRIIEPGYTKIEKWQKWADKIKDIPGDETFLEGYVRDDGQIVTTYKLDGIIYGINYNSFQNQPLTYLSNVNPVNFIIEKGFKYRYMGKGTKCPDPIKQLPN